MPSPFEFSPYHDANADNTIAQLLSDRGRIQAEGARASGNAWAGAVQNIAQNVAQIPQQIQQQKQQAIQQQTQQNTLTDQNRSVAARDAFSKLLKDTPQLSEDGVSVWDIGTISKGMAAAGFGPEGASAAQHLDAVNNAFRQARAAQLAVVKTGAQAVIASGNDPSLAGHFIDQLETNKLYPTDQIAKFRAFIQEDPKNVAKLTAYLAGPQPLTVLPRGATAITQGGATVATGQPAAPTEASLAADAADPKSPTQAQSAAALAKLKESAPKYQTENVTLDGKPNQRVGFDPTTNTYWQDGKDVTARVTSNPPASMQVNVTDKADREDLSQMLVDGLILPVDLSKRGASYNAVISEANRKSIKQTGKSLNINKLKLDYEAAKRFVGSMNGSQMTRFKGLAGSVVNTIDEVKRLGDELKQGSIQKWNSVSRKSVQQFYGNTPQSELANQYMAALNTLKEEFANLANGGYAPTEAAWKLADQQINGDFGFKDLNTSLIEVQRLINYRIGAFDALSPTLAPTTTPSGTTAADPYDEYLKRQQGGAGAR